MFSDTDTKLFEVDRRTLMKGLAALGVATTVSGSAKAQPIGARNDPYRNNRFIVEIEGLLTASFASVDIPDATVEGVSFRGGGDPPTTRKLLGMNEYGPIVLETGITDGTIELFDWFKSAQEGDDDARRNLAVTMLTPRGDEGPRWEFRDAWPALYKGPTLDAMDGGVAIETLEVLHEGMRRVA